MASLAKKDPSPVVRLYLASAVQRLGFQERWPILAGLVSHPEDIKDNNLPRMYWFGLEPMVPENRDQALQLAVSGKIPKLSEFVARRLASGNAKVVPYYQKGKFAAKQPASREQWQKIIQQVAPGFQVRNVGEGGVVWHKVFRNQAAVQTHPLDRKSPSSLHRKLLVPAGMTTQLKIRVSHHPHGDWQLRVLVNGKVISDQLVSSKTVSPDEWLDVAVDLSNYAGQKVDLVLENRANDWFCEWAYWNRVQLVSEKKVASNQ